MPEDQSAAHKRTIDVGAAIVAALTAVVAGAALWESRDFSPLGSIFPRTIAIGLLLGSLAALARSLLGWGSRTHGIPRDGLLRSALLVSTMVLWIALLEPVGFIASSVVAFFALALIADREPVTVRRVLLFAVASVVVVVAFYLVFVQALKVQLPHGALI